jgi:hypothetical protein
MQLVVAKFLKILKKIINFGVGLLFADLRFSRKNLEPNPFEKRGMSVADWLVGWLVGLLDVGGILF